MNFTGANGNINISGTVTEGSDVRIKENIKPLKSQLEIVNKLNPVSYNKIGFEENEIGFIAQEVEEFLPELVSEDKEGMKSIAYSKMNTILVKAIQELKAEVDKLKQECKCKKLAEKILEEIEKVANKINKEELANFAKSCQYAIKSFA